MYNNVELKQLCSTNGKENKSLADLKISESVLRSNIYLFSNKWS
jgi:hypothetical protein